ncbi:hypothetical protein C4565_00405 [Candidatus Parcubacteria bacterium]|nr:MAG: hypothetical protein C4565_00405 [Candidatus Parcubacteria bacterium]
MQPWEEKANKIIASMCRGSWYMSNHDKHGRRFKRHRPYTVPPDAQLLVECLGKGDEETAKSIFIRHVYGIVYGSNTSF